MSGQKGLLVIQSVAICDKMPLDVPRRQRWMKLCLVLEDITFSAPFLFVGCCPPTHVFMHGCMHAYKSLQCVFLMEQE